MCLDEFCSPVLLYLMEFCIDRDVIQLLKSSKIFYRLKSNYKLKRFVKCTDTNRGFKADRVIVTSMKKLHSNPLTDAITRVHFLDDGYAPIYFNDEVMGQLLPNSVTHFTFSTSPNENLLIHRFPQSLTDLTLTAWFNHTIEPNVLPQSLKFLRFGQRFNQLLGVNVLPASLKYLSFGRPYRTEYIDCDMYQGEFNSQIAENTLPDSLEQLHFGWVFNQRLHASVIAKSLTRLTVGYCFQQNLDETVIPVARIVKVTKGTKYGYHMFELRPSV